MKQENKSARVPHILLIWLGALAVMLSFVLVGGVGAVTGGDQSKLENASVSDEVGQRVVIRTRGGGKLGISKAELSRRPRSAGGEATPSRRALPTAADPIPTILKLNFPTLVDPGQEVKGTLRFNDPDDFVYSIFITVFFPDGDVVTTPLYYYPDDGGDVFKGRYNFWVEMPLSETPLTGRIVITCSDEYLNVSEVSQRFALFY